MPNKKKSNDTLRRLLFVLRLVPAYGQGLSASALHGQLEDAGYPCSLRTAQRDLKMLTEEFGFDVDDSGQESFYSWMKGAKGFVIPALTHQDSLLLALAEKHLDRLLPAKTLKSMKSFFLAAERDLDTTRAAREKGWLSKVRVVSTTQPLLPPDIKPVVLEAIGEGLYWDHCLNVSFKNRTGAERDAVIKPLGLVQQGVRLYLVCQFEGYDNYRILAVNRIAKAEFSAITFERPAEFDLASYDDDGKFGLGDGKKIRLSFSISKNEGLLILESRLSKDQTYAEHEDCYRITATVIQSQMLDRWLRGFGDHVWDIEKSPLQIPLPENGK